ncbi:hypothetical protein IEQ34_006897 [Dendrobium chrysotoxum]|uniref:DUF4283 domain-containing protein n=1 Tax=Dendrobium chrysotoxum TaxID=161865 RepID=A0AAV7H5E5_DENCH|nr:hypothetical protein IEQ34_006897 [Dendrobium chrysotoxum]
MDGKRLVDPNFLDGKTSSKSFHDALSGSSSSFPELKITTHRGFPSLWISETETRILHGLGSIFGRPLKIDHATSIGSRPSVARVLMELDVFKHFPDKVWVGPDNLGYIQSMVMEDFPSYCSHCKSLGQSKSECHILHPHLVKAHTNVGDDPIDTELVNNGNKIGHLVVPSTNVLLDPPEQVVSGIDVSLSVALSLAPSCGNNEVIVVASSPIITPDSNVDVNDGETALSDDSTPLPGDRAYVSPAGGILPSNCSKSANSLVTPPRSSASLPKGVDPLAENSGLPLVEVPISFLSNDALIAHLTGNMRDSEVVHGD